jgi:hypothetical protein
VNIERNELIELLRSRGDDHTAERAEQSLPQHIGVRRDRQLLRQCGIDPNVLGLFRSGRDHTTGVSEPSSQTADVDADEDDGVVTTPETPSVVGQVSPPSSPGKDQRADPMTWGSTSGSEVRAASFHVTPRPAIRCPRCRVAFGSPDLMLEHLNDHHLHARHQTDTPAEGDDVLSGDAAVPDDEVARLHAF